MKSQQQLVSSSSFSDNGDDKIFSLGYDIAIRIFLLLPLKSLFLSKCVSKKWLAAISDPSFAKQKLASSTPISGLLKQPIFMGKRRYVFIPDCRISEEVMAISKAITSLKIGGENVHILDSTKGLLLCAKKKGKQYLIYNTLTKNYVSVPIPFLCSRRRNKFVKLIFEENRRLQIIQFSENWKYEPELHIYKQERWNWKTSKVPLSWPDHCFPLSSIPILVRKTFFWMSMGTVSMCAYNMEKNEFYFPPIPPIAAPVNALTSFLCESIGTLYYVEKFYTPSTLINVWVLQSEEISSAWDLAHQIDTQHICIGHDIDPEKKTVEIFPFSLHSTDPDLLFVNITPTKYGLLHMGKLELTLVFDLQNMVGAIGGRSKYFLNEVYSFWVCPFEEPLWMLSLTRGPNHFPSKSKLSRYLTCYQ